MVISGDGGERPPPKPLEWYDGDTFRAVYTVRFQGAVYVLHAFIKISAHGIAMRREDERTIRARLEQAKAHHETKYGGSADFP